MLGDLENQLIALIKGSTLGSRLRTVDSLPDVPDKDVVKRWGTDAPAAYVVAMDGSLSYSVATPRFVVVMVARNARGHQKARHGDGKLIGLYEMLDAGIALLNGGTTPDASWQTTGYQFLRDTALADQGLFVGMVAIQAELDPPQPEETNVGEFLQFHADIDVEPFTPDEHERWVNEDHAEPAPDLQSDINPREFP